MTRKGMTAQQEHAEMVRRDDKIHQLANQGLTWEQISNRLSISESTVQNVIIRGGTPAEFVPRKDSIPDGGIYADTGCNVSKSCLNCHLPQCIYDKGDTQRVNRGLTPVERVERDTKIFELRKKGVPLADISRAYNLSKRALMRIIARGGPSEHARTVAIQVEGNVNTGAKPVEELKTFYKARKPWPAIRGAK